MFTNNNPIHSIFILTSVISFITLYAFAGAAALIPAVLTAALYLAAKHMTSSNTQTASGKTREET